MFFVFLRISSYFFVNVLCLLWVCTVSDGSKVGAGFVSLTWQSPVDVSHGIQMHPTYPIHRYISNMVSQGVKEIQRNSKKLYKCMTNVWQMYVTCVVIWTPMLLNTPIWIIILYIVHNPQISTMYNYWNMCVCLMEIVHKYNHVYIYIYIYIYIRRQS